MNNSYKKIIDFFHHSPHQASVWVCFLCLVLMVSCKTKKHTQQTAGKTPMEDTLQGRCRLNFKSAKTLIKHIKEKELNYQWINAKADIETWIDGEEHKLDVRIRGRKDSAIWISIQAAGLLDIAKLLITKDSVKMVVYIKKQYFVGDFNYINQMLNADLDFDLIQAALFGNSADFDNDDTKLKPVIDRENCRYMLSTERKRKLKRLTQGQDSLKHSLQTMTLNPDNFKILNNDFIEALTNRSFHATYDKFVAIDSVYAPHLVNIEIKAERKVNLKISYVRIEINQPQKLTLNIPKNYDPISVNKENPQH